VAALRWPTVSAATPNDTAVATASVLISSTSRVALQKYRASTTATSSVVITLDATMPLKIAWCSATAVITPPVNPIWTPG